MANIEIYKIRLQYIVVKLIKLPRFCAPAIRGVFGYALKESNRDAFDNLFAKSESGAKQKSYVINSLETKFVYLPGDKFYFDIILFGDVINDIPIQAFINFENYEIGQQKGKLKFDKAFSVNPDSLKQIHHVSEAESYKFNFNKTVTDNVRLKFHAPFCIKKIDKPEAVNFENIIKRIYERIIGLGLWDTSSPEETDFVKARKIITKQSNFISYNVKHYSKQRRMYIYYRPAFIGSIEFYGDIKAFAELLQIGEQIHIGRGTSSGLGGFEIEYL